MSIRNALISLTTAVLCTLPLLAQADDLIINNNTDYDSASVINHGICSDKLGPVGVTHAREFNHVVPASVVRMACKFNMHQCQADVYISPNCAEGTKIATVMVDVDTGIIGRPVSDDPRFDIDGSGFSFTLTQK